MRVAHTSTRSNVPVIYEDLMTYLC